MAPEPCLDVASRLAITDTLIRWGPSHFQSFPWRDDAVPAWQGLLAEVLLQRTKASQAARVFEHIRDKYPSPEMLATASDVEIADLLRPLGLHWRTPLFIALARELAEVGGEVPNSPAALRALPCVGPYAAAATLSFHLGIRAVLIDSNIVRVLARLVAQPFGPETRRARWMRDLAASLTPTAEHRRYNYGLLDHAMTVCTVRTPRCGLCPLAPWCGSAPS